MQLRDAATRTVAFTGVQREQEDGVITVTPVDVTGRDLGAIQTQYGLPDNQTADPSGRISMAGGVKTRMLRNQIRTSSLRSH